MTRLFLVFTTQRFWTEGDSAEADREADAAPPGGPRQDRTRGRQATGGGDLPLDRGGPQATTLQSEASAGGRGCGLDPSDGSGAGIIFWVKKSNLKLYQSVPQNTKLGGHLTPIFCV